MVVEAIVTNMWWILLVGGFVCWFFGAVEGYVMGKIMNSGKK